MIDPVDVPCPYCGEVFGTTVDCSGGSAQYVEDCAVCCRPIVFLLRVSCQGGIESLELRREDDA